MASESENSSVVMVDNTTTDGGLISSNEAAQTSDKSNDSKKEGEEKSESKTDEVKSEKDGETKEEEKEKVMVGMICDQRDLYQKLDQHNRVSWTDKYPDDLEEAAENEETAKYALLVRNRKSEDSRKKLDIDSIIIQSPLLKNVLREVLKDYPGVTTTLARLTFTAPFRPFVHRWDRLAAALKSDAYDEATKAHLQLLYNVLNNELKDVVGAYEDYVKTGVVTYEHAWTIFHPETIVLASKYGRPAAVRLKQGDYIKHCRLGHCFQLTCERVEFDGSKFGYETSKHYILPFMGTMPISELESYPLSYATNHQAIATSLITRGRLFESFAGTHFKAYNGPAIEQTREGPSLLSVDCRVVIDAAAHGRTNPNMRPYLKPLGSSTSSGPRGGGQLLGDPDDDEYYSDYSDDDDYDNGGSDEFAKFSSSASKSKQRRATIPLTEDQLLLCTPVVKGFALKTKKWLEFYIDNVRDIAFNEHAFDSLVLPEGHKSLILAFAQSQTKNKACFDDVISGKGQGIIMLLSGGPGIGKTLTAESVAENMRVPLYTMSAGDLGTTSDQVEDNLAEILEMVAKWDAVLLLDECDVFLEARSAHDLDRNRIVSIFLRTLEYYQGILFLTTNRVADMDQAFHSRIHISLEYPDLDAAARRAVWRGFLERGGPGSHEVGEEDLERLARLEINGRIIKNILKTGNLLASHKEEKLNFGHLKTVLQVEGHKIE